MVRGKFVVSKVAKTAWGSQVNSAVEVTLTAQYDQSIEEDRKFAKATPSAQITMYIDNPPAAEYLELGKTFYVDFTLAE